MHRPGRDGKRLELLNSQSLPPSQADTLVGDIPLNCCLIDRPHRYDSDGSANGKSPESITNGGVWVETARGKTQI